MMTNRRIYSCQDLLLLSPHHAGLGQGQGQGQGQGSFARSYTVAGCADRLGLSNAKPSAEFAIFKLSLPLHSRSSPNRAWFASITLEPHPR